MGAAIVWMAPREGAHSVELGGWPEPELLVAADRGVHAVAWGEKKKRITERGNYGEGGGGNVDASASACSAASKTQVGKGETASLSDVVVERWNRSNLTQGDGVLRNPNLCGVACARCTRLFSRNIEPNWV